MLLWIVAEMYRTLLFTLGAQIDHLPFHPQAAMALRLDSKWAAVSQDKPPQQPSASGGGGGPGSVAATVAAALSLLPETPADQARHGSPDQQEQQQQSHDQKLQHAQQQEVMLSGAKQALLSAHAAFLRSSRALRGTGSHSSYQRAMANCLTSMRMMHVLEDSSSGGCWFCMFYTLHFQANPSSDNVLSFSCIRYLMSNVTEYCREYV